MINRRRSLLCRVGSVAIGGGEKIVVQSMTDTDTADQDATVKQIAALVNAGAEIVRITVNDENAARAVPYIREALLKKDITVPLVGDFHYNGHRLLQNEACAKALDKYRINPGNVGFSKKRDEQFSQMVEIALKHHKPIRIGVNWGSLDQALLTQLMDQNASQASPQSAAVVMREALVTSALGSAEHAVTLGMPKNKIIISCKVSDVLELVAVYRMLASRCEYPLHVGLTEAGMGLKGMVCSSAALAILLHEGIGDTIRCSITPEVGAPRTTEVLLCQQLLQSLGLRYFMPVVTSCPGCGRTTSDYFRKLTAEVSAYLQEARVRWREQFPGSEQLNIAVMGCVVNGPGESKHADVGISLPGSGEDPVAPVFMDGKKVATLRGDTLKDDFLAMLETYVANRFG